MRKTSLELYSEWLCRADDKTKNELLSIEGNKDEIEERFYCDLAFGTAGMRGVIGAGTNRMNEYVVRRATQGLAEYIKKDGNCDKGVVIGYDTRYFSREFAIETARVLVANGIKAYLFDVVHATPEVSFAIRYYGAVSGVMITASHNPKEYNGYKVYGSDGAQLPPDKADLVVNEINKFDMFSDIKTITDDKLNSSPLLNIIGSEVDNAFLEAVYAQSIDADIIKKAGDDFKIVYTPFHGTGLRPVMAIFEKMGIKNVIVDPEQAKPDPAFSTVKSPNPEDKEGFKHAIELAGQNGASLIVGTDPDADRVGVVVRDSEGEYRSLTGNQIGALLCEYILSAKQKKGILSEKSTIIKTIVSSNMCDAIAKSYGAKVIDVLTGFKYIAEKIALFEQTGSGIFELGFEESSGYLIGSYARDKDSVGAVMLIAEMAAMYKTKGMTLYEAIEGLFKKYGYYEEKTVSIVMPGKDGMEKMKAMMEGIRNNMPSQLGGIEIKIKQDYKTGIQINPDKSQCSLEGFPSSDVLKFMLSDDKTFVAIRPSGTEPKIKLYLGTAADSPDAAKSQINYLEGALRGYLGL